MAPSFILMSEKLRKKNKSLPKLKGFQWAHSMHKTTFISRIRELFIQYFVSKLLTQELIRKAQVNEKVFKITWKPW